MKKQGVILDMSCDKLAFCPGHYTHPGVPAAPPASPPVSPLASPPVTPPASPPSAPAPVPQAPAPKYIIPRRRSSEPVEAPVSKDKPLDLALIGGAAFQYLAQKQKDVEIFAVPMRDIEYQLYKGEKPVTYPRTVVSEECHDFLDVFSKAASNPVSHSKHDHKVKSLEEGKDHGHSPLCGMSRLQLKFVKQYLEEHLKKGFIKASSAPCSSLILLAKKAGGGIRFCVD